MAEGSPSHGSDAALSPDQLFNVNIGVLGHVDSGKTCLVAALSTKLSTAALDKHPQSKQRGITLDLGFSAFVTDLPPQVISSQYKALQVTLVDCPGHASLIRTVIGGAQIIDAMLLVIDITKGIQAQTAECLVVGEIAVDRMAVVLNKCDLVAAEQRERTIQVAGQVVRRTLAATRFAGCTVIAASARPGGGDAYKPLQQAAEGLDAVSAEVLAMVPAKPREVGPNFLFAIDHCFPIKGQGTVFTGTVLQGRAQVNATIELPEQKQQRKIKSIQVFKHSVSSCQQGDRAGICVTRFDAEGFERGLACTPGTVPTFTGAIAAVDKIRFYPGEVGSRAKLHVSVGHSTVMADATFFGEPDGKGSLTSRMANASIQDTTGFDFGQEYLYQDQLYGLRGRPAAALAGAGGAPAVHRGRQWALLHFQQAVTAPQDALVIGSRLDADAGAQQCRLVMAGRLVALVDPAHAQQMARLRVFKVKQRQGSIHRVEAGGQSAICQGMFKKESDITAFVGMKVVTSAGETGSIEGTFGKSGRFRVAFPGGVRPAGASEQRQISLSFKKLVFDPGQRRISQ